MRTEANKSILDVLPSLFGFEEIANVSSLEEALAITGGTEQSLVSKIRKIEDRIDVTLLERHQDQIVFTEKARRIFSLYEHVRDRCALLEQQLASEGEARPLLIFVDRFLPTRFQRYWLDKSLDLSRFKRYFKAVQSREASELFHRSQAVSHRDRCASFISSSSRKVSLGYKEALDYQWVVAKGTELAVDEPLSIVMPPRGSALYDEFMARLHNSGVSWRAEMEVEDLGQMIDIVQSGVGAAMIPAECLTANLERCPLLSRAEDNPTVFVNVVAQPSVGVTLSSLGKNITDNTIVLKPRSAA